MWLEQCFRKNPTKLWGVVQSLMSQGTSLPASAHPDLVLILPDPLPAWRGNWRRVYLYLVSHMKSLQSQVLQRVEATANLFTAFYQFWKPVGCAGFHLVRSTLDLKKRLPSSAHQRGGWMEDRFQHPSWTLWVFSNAIWTNQHPCRFSSFNQWRITEFSQQVRVCLFGRHTDFFYIIGDTTCPRESGPATSWKSTVCKGREVCVPRSNPWVLRFSDGTRKDSREDQSSKGMANTEYP